MLNVDSALILLSENSLDTEIRYNRTTARIDYSPWTNTITVGGAITNMTKDHLLYEVPVQSIEVDWEHQNIILWVDIEGEFEYREEV